MLKKFKNIYRSSSLKKKLALSYFVIFFIPLIFFIFSLIKITYDSAIEKVTANSVMTLKQVVSNVNVLFDNAVNTSRMVVSNSYVQEYYSTPPTSSNATERFKAKSGAKVFLDTIIEPKSNIDSIIVFSPDGYHIASSRIDETSLENIYSSEDDSLDEILIEMNQNWGTPVYIATHKMHTRFKDANYLSILKPVILTSSGLISGIAQVNIDEQVILDFYKNIDSSQNGYILLLSSDGTIVSCKENEYLYQNLQSADFYQWALNNPDNGRKFMIQDSEYLVTSTAYENLGWTALHLLPIGQVTFQTKQYILLSCIFVGLCIITIALFSNFFIRSITKPVDKLIVSMSNAAQGDLSVKVSVADGDEISQLADSFNNMLSQISELIEQVYNEKLLKEKSQLLVLQAQINPHFLYNSLESIRALIQMKDTEKAYEIIRSLEIFYQTCLSKGKNIITLEEEFQNVTNYLQIQKVRYYGKLNYEIDLDCNLKEYSIVKLSIQPIVENAIYHGLRPKPEKGNIIIKCYGADNLIHIEISDDGVGMTQDKLECLYRRSNNSYGLYNVNQRIKLYFGNDYGIAIHSDPGKGTRIEIILPRTLLQEEEEVHDFRFNS